MEKIDENIAKHYVERINEHVAEDEFRDALDILQEFSNDFSDTHKKDTVILRGRYNRWKRARDTNVPVDENINAIGLAIMEMADDIMLNRDIPKNLLVQSDYENARNSKNTIGSGLSESAEDFVVNERPLTLIADHDAASRPEDFSSQAEAVGEIRTGG